MTNITITINIDIDDGFNKYRDPRGWIYSGSIDTILNDKFGKDTKYLLQSSNIRAFTITCNNQSSLNSNEVRRIIRNCAMSGPYYFKDIKFLNENTIYVQYNDKWDDTNENHINRNR